MAKTDPTYREKVYNALKGELGDSFNKSFEEFNASIDSNPEYIGKVYNALKGELGDSFNKSQDEFNSLIDLKKKEPTKQEVGQEVGVSVEEPTPSPSVSQEQVEEAPASALDQLEPLSQIFEAPMFTDPVERAGGAIESPEIDILSDEDEEMLKSEKPYGFEKYITGDYEDPKEDLKAKRNALIKHQKETEEKYAAYPEEERMQLMSETQADYGEIFLNYLDKTDPNNARRLRRQRQSDMDFYSDTDKITLPFVPRQNVEMLEELGMIPEILPEVKRISPANQIRLNGLQLVMDVKQDNLDSSVKAFDDKYGNEFTALTDKLQGMQNLISGNTFNGTENQYNEYMNGVNRLKELESTPEYLGYQQSFDEYKLFEEEYKKDSVVREADFAALEAYSYQLKKDEEYKESGLLGRSFINASDITKGALMRLFQSAATLPKILMPDNEYALSDGLKDYVDNVAKVYNERNPKPSAFTKEGLTSSVANVNGYEVEMDGDEPTGRVFDKDGYLLPRKTVAGYTTFSATDDVFAEDIVKVYESNKDEYDIEETINIASNLYTAGEVTADMFVTLAPISRTVTLTTKAGTASKAAKLLRIGEVSEKTAGNFGTFTGIMVQSSNGFYDAAIEAGASESEASSFSAFQSAIIGTIALLNPVESKAIANMFTGQSSKEYAKKYVSEILKGKTRSEAMKSVVSNVVKKAGQLNYEMFKEGIEEITEIPAGQFGDYLFDLGTTTPGEIQDYIDTFAVAYLASGPMSLISLRGNNPNMSTMLYSAMGDIEYVENLLKKNINKEVRLADGGKKLITEEFVQEQMDRLNRIKTISEPYLQNDALTENEKKLVVSLVNKRQALSETLKNADDVVGKKSKQEIEAINTQLERFLDKKDGSPFYLVEGKAISKEDLDEKIADENWVKGFKEGRWAVHITNDQDAINRLKEATEGKPVVEAEVEAEVEEAPVEEQVSVNKGDKIQFSSDGQVFDGVVTRQTEDGVYIESDVSGEETLIPTNKVIATADMGIVAGDSVFIETEEGSVLGKVKSITDTEIEIDNPDVPGQTMTIDRNKARKIKEGDEVQYNVEGELETFKVKRVDGDQVIVENQDVLGGEISLSADEVTLKDPFKRVEDDTQVTEEERLDTEKQGRKEDTGQVQEPKVSQKEGAADTVLQEEVEANESSVNDLIDELNATDPKTVPPSKTREMVKVARNVKKALNTLSKLLPDVKIVVHKTSEGYVSSAEGRLSGEGGEYNPNTKTIHINLEKATPTTVAHEVFHAVLIESLGTVDTMATTEEMLDRVLKSAKVSDDVKTKLSEHMAKYPEGIQSEEALAELTGILASEYSSLSLTAKGAIKSWANKLSRAVGLGNMFDQFAKDKEVIDLLNVLSGKLSRGEVLEEDDVKEISRRRKPTDEDVKKPESKKEPKKEEKKQRIRKQIIGRNAKLSSEVRNNLLRARSMESRGNNKKDIKIQTGWERGKDNKWRYELPDDIPYFKDVTKAISDVLLGKRKADSFGIINENGKLTISGKLAFPGNILDAYPELENYDVSFNKFINQGEGEMSALFETIDVGIGQVNTAKDMEESMSKAIPVLIHEIQHAIQEIEDFGRGGNLSIGQELLKSKFPKAKELYEQLVSDRNFVESVIDEHRNLPQGEKLVTAIKQAFLEQSIVDFEEGGAKAYEVASKIYDLPKFKKVAEMIGLMIPDEVITDVKDLDPNSEYFNIRAILTKNEKERFKNEKNEIIEIIERILLDSREITGSMYPGGLRNVISQINFEISKISDPKTKFEAYQRIAGEVEARNVMERMEMSEELRAETTLEETEDVAREDQIVIGIEREVSKKLSAKKPGIKKISDIRKQKVDDDKKAYEDGSKELNQKVKKKEDAQRSYSDRKIIPLIRALRKRFFDFQGFTKSMLRKAELGRIADRLTNAKGAGGRAKAIFKEYYDKIYDGLSISERKHLDNLITYRRIVSANEARIRSNAEAEIEFEKVSQEIKDLKEKSKLTKDEKAELNKLESKKKDLKKKKDRGEIMTGSIGLDDAKAAIRGLESIVGSEVFEKINGRANEYFGAFDEMLDKDLKDGLVTKEQYDAMKGIDYSPRVWMIYVYDLEGDAVLMRDALDRLKKKFSLSEANYQTLKEGLKNNDPNMLGTLMMDSEILLSTYLNTREKKRSFNNLNQEMAKELAKLIPEFEELSAKKDLTKEEKTRLKYLKQVNDSFSLTPRTGFREMFYYSEGKREKFYVKDEIYDEWYDNKKGVLDKSIESGISKWTGVKLLKASATGANPLFAITNFPRDFFQVLLFSNAYSEILPKSMAQLTVDFFKSWSMIHTDSKEFKEFVKYGGMMDFLYTDGRVDQGDGMKSKIKDFIASTKVGDNGYYKGAKLFEKAADLASYLNMISEIGFRLSVYNKVLSNEMKKLDKNRKGMTPEEIMMAEEDARYRAAAAARELIDFSIGGDVIKGADPYLPYINAAAQGTYTALRYSYENPAAISIKTLQATGVVSGAIMLLGTALVAANRDDDDENSVKEIMIETYNGVSPHIRKNYFIIPLGTKDEKGHYKYFKIAKNQSLAPFFVLTESIMESYYLGNKESNKSLGFRMLDSFSSSFMPLDVNPYTPEGAFEGFDIVGNTFSKNPVIGGTLEWATGYNFFRNEPLSRDGYSTEIGSDAWANFSDSRTEEFYKDFAQFMDESGGPAVSPAKIKNSVERLITSPYTNPFTNALYVTLDSQTDYAKSFNKQSGIEDITKDIMKGFAGEKRLIGSASYKPEDSKLSESDMESVDKKISDINKGKEIAKTYGRRIGKELSMDQDFIDASNKDKMKIAEEKFTQVIDFASRKGVELESKEIEMLQRKFMSQVNIRNRDIELYKFYDVMYETDPRIQALTWIKEFGYLDPKSDDYKELMIEYKNTYNKTMGKNVSENFFQNIGRYYKEDGRY